VIDKIKPTKQASKADAKKPKSSRLEDETNKTKRAEEVELRKLSEEEVFKKFDTSKCGYKGCHESTTILGRVCLHCRLKFCISHSMAEIHGCGEEAKKKAREDWTNNYPSRDGQSTRTLKPQTRKQLQDKLKKKIGTVTHKGKKPSEK